MNDYDILLLSETWISRKTSLNLDINGYLCGTKSPWSSKGRYSGGVSLYEKHYLKDKLEIIDKNSEGIKLDAELISFKENVYICCVYIPSSDSKKFFVQRILITGAKSKGA